MTELELGNIISKILLIKNAYSKYRLNLFRYGDTWGDWHGGNGGYLHNFEINNGSAIMIVQGK